MHPASPPAGEVPCRRLVAMRRHSDQLWTLLFCVGSCLDVLADLAAELEERDAQALQTRIADARERTAELRRRLHETERLLVRHAGGPSDDVVWRFEA